MRLFLSFLIITTILSFIIYSAAMILWSSATDSNSSINLIYAYIEDRNENGLDAAGQINNESEISLPPKPGIVYCRLMAYSMTADNSNCTAALSWNYYSNNFK